MSDELARLLMVSGTLDTSGIGAPPAERVQHVSFAFQEPGAELPLERSVPESEVEDVVLTDPEAGPQTEGLTTAPTPEELAAAELAAAELAAAEQAAAPVVLAEPQAPVKRTRKTAAAKSAAPKE